jgi:hypothetical protein
MRGVQRVMSLSFRRLFFLLLGLVTRALRWQVLLNGSLVLHRAFSIMNVAYLVNGVLPLRLGEVARVYLTTRLPKPIPVLTTTSTIIVERLLDLLAVVMLMSLALATGNVPTELRFAGGVFSDYSSYRVPVAYFLGKSPYHVESFLGLVAKASSTL